MGGTTGSYSRLNTASGPPPVGVTTPVSALSLPKSAIASSSPATGGQLTSGVAIAMPRPTKCRGALSLSEAGASLFVKHPPDEEVTTQARRRMRWTFLLLAVRRRAADPLHGRPPGPGAEAEIQFHASGPPGGLRLRDEADVRGHGRGDGSSEIPARRSLRPGQPPVRGRHDVPRQGRAGWHSGQAARAAGPPALRPRLRPARPLPPRAPRPDLPDHAHGPRRRVAGQAGHDRQLLRDLRRNPESEAARGLRLLLTPFPQQQFNQTEDRRTLRPTRAVACLDCHSNDHTNASFHLVGDIRPQEFRRRIDTPSLRGVNIQRLFGSQRALKSVEDFTEVEQRAAYFDGDPGIATKKGVNLLERGSQVHFMAEIQRLMDLPSAR